jgi:hypothetical protein
MFSGLGKIYNAVGLFIKEPHVMLAEMSSAEIAGRDLPTSNITVTNIVANTTSVIIVICFARARTLPLTYSAASTGTKELAVELAEGSKKLSDGGWGCAALSMLVMETLIV